MSLMANVFLTLTYCKWFPDPSFRHKLGLDIIDFYLSLIARLIDPTSAN